VFLFVRSQRLFSWKVRPASSVILIRVTIKAIIFDLGGVLLRTQDFTVRERLAERLSMDRHELEEFIFGGDTGDKAQRGEITVQQHWEHLRHQLGCTPQEFRKIVDEFFVMDKLDDGLVDFVRELHKNYRTALLSNAWDNLRQIIADSWHFEDAFDAIIISSEVGMVKPDPRIFRFALDQLKVAADEAIFVDDFQHNVDAAQTVGMQAIRFRTAQQVQRDLDKLLDRR
jgi:epoxide hydrolase-like predicted phosphatase